MSRLRGILAVIVGLGMSTGAMVPARADDPFMTLGAYTTQPVGHFDYCRRRPQDCVAGQARPAAPLHLSSEALQRVARVNREVNAALRPASDMHLYGQEEVWTLPVDRGDCEDYALMKRQRLIEAGVPAGNLLMTVVRKTNGEGHAVLTLTTRQGDFVLDNLDNRVRAWAQTPYRFLKRQDATDPGRWVSIEPDRDIVTVAALERPGSSSNRPPAPLSDAVPGARAVPAFAGDALPAARD